jgi:hypothetical protein
MGDIFSDNIKYIDVFYIDCEVEGVMCEVVLRAELPATSELKAQILAVCVADSFRDRNAPAQGLCCSVASSKSKSSKIFLFKGCWPVAIMPIVALFLFALPDDTLPKSSNTS